MIPVESRDVKKIVVYDIIEYSVSELLDYTPPGAPLFWQSGFIYFPVLFSSKFSDEAILKDHTHLMRAFFYAKYPKYTSEIKNAHSQPIQIIIDKSPITESLIAHIKNTKK